MNKMLIKKNNSPDLDGFTGWLPFQFGKLDFFVARLIWVSAGSRFRAELSVIYCWQHRHQESVKMTMELKWRLKRERKEAERQRKIKRSNKGFDKIVLELKIEKANKRTNIHALVYKSTARWEKKD